MKELHDIFFATVGVVDPIRAKHAGQQNAFRPLFFIHFIHFVPFYGFSEVNHIPAALYLYYRQIYGFNEEVTT
jgi:hypothetical protein